MINNQPIWIICGKCGSRDIEIKISKDSICNYDGSLEDDVIFSCNNCSTLTSKSEFEDRLNEEK